MKTKTINAVITKKINEWLESIDDEILRKDISKNVIVTGGCIASMLIREKVNDYDIYFRTNELSERVFEYYKGKTTLHEKNMPYRPEDIEDDCIEDDENIKKYEPVFFTKNAITLTGKMQIVMRFYGEPDEIHDNFDFIHCMNYWDSKDGKTILRKDALEALLTRELTYVGSLFPLCSIIRTRKFIQRGWTVNAGQYVKMAMQLNELDLTDIEVLKEQLIGVDALYFFDLLSTIQEGGKTINSAYICEIIDRIF